MSAGGSLPAGSGRALRLDPFALPIRFEAEDVRADRRVRMIELTRERVVMRRALHGMRMAVNLPLSAFRGIAVRLIEPRDGHDGGVAVTLEHRDPSLSVPLFRAQDGQDIVAEWQAWGRALGLPLLVVAADGSLREPFARIGVLAVSAARARRRSRSPLKRRRPTMPMRRKPGNDPAGASVHAGEREIIARH